jgi:glycosyltransferase involved in cell wall biosynthesis
MGGSHADWARGYAQHSRHEVEIVALPAGHWKWRMHGGHLALAPRLADAVRRSGAFDVLLASSMTNLPSLLGHARRVVGNVPVMLYMHENQLTYPRSDHAREDLTYAMINWSSMAAADAVAFNSAFHRDVWFDAVDALLDRMPDLRVKALVADVRARSTVLPVGIDVAAITRIPRVRSPRPLVLWNQRWEHDKGPTEFVAALRSLLDAGCDVDVALAGERPTEQPTELQELRRALGRRLVHDGHADRTGYLALLRRSDIVVSTARHEFFGVAIAEAIAAGAFPVLPNRLVYPERIPPEHHARCLYDDAPGLVDRLAWAAANRDDAAGLAHAIAPTTTDLAWPVVADRYDRALVELAG